uniref:Uncharacterized protein n=1 Tax=Solanum tuberosum TaxID=4113 RepID=M1C8C9_SOLTU
MANGLQITNLDHEIKLLLVNDGITFEGLAKKIFQVLKLKVGEIKANIWFDSNLETRKGMQVTNDEEVTTCIYLLKNDPNFKTSCFIVDIAENNSLSAVNIVQHEEMQIERDETSIPIEPISEFEPLETKSSHVEAVNLPSQPLRPLRLSEDHEDLHTARGSVRGALPIINQNLEKLECKRRREVKNPSSRTQQVSSSSNPEIEGFLRGIRHQLYVISAYSILHAQYLSSTDAYSALTSSRDVGSGSQHPNHA